MGRRDMAMSMSMSLKLTKRKQRRRKLLLGLVLVGCCCPSRAFATDSDLLSPATSPSAHYPAPHHTVLDLGSIAIVCFTLAIAVCVLVRWICSHSHRFEHMNT